MIWVCRPGKGGRFFSLFSENSRIYLAWEGYKLDLSFCKTVEDFRNLVIAEKNPKARASINNWASQLYSFCVDMQIGDYVLIPSKHSRTYMLAKICGEYEFNKNDELLHSRKINVLIKDIPRARFKKSTQHSLGAFRTIFRAKNENEILNIAKEISANAEDVILNALDV